VNILIYGASGMVGQGVLRECLQAEDIESVTIAGRSVSPLQHPKLWQIVTSDIAEALGDNSSQYDACFFCLGVSASGMTEGQYSKITYDLTLNIARRLAESNRKMTFIYVSGAGTDSTEKGRVMWARVKGKTENALLALGFDSALMFRPAVIQPLNGIESKTSSYRLVYRLAAPFFPVLRLIFPRSILTTVEMGNAMLNAVRYGSSKNILEMADISLLAKKRHNK